MPNARGHFFGGAIFHLVFILLFSKRIYLEAILRSFFYGLPFVTIGALLPDIDINSYGRKLLLFVTICLISYSIAFCSYHASLGALLLLLLGHLSKHRGIMHHPILLVIIPAPIFGILQSNYSSIGMLNRFAYLSFLNGAFSHVVLDFVSTKVKRMFNKRFGNKPVKKLKK